MHSKFVTTTLNKTRLEDLPLELYCFMDVTSVLDASFQSSFLLYYTLPVKSFRSVRFFMFLKEVSSAHQGNYLIKKYKTKKQKKNNSNIVKYYYNLKQRFSM